MDKNLVKSLTDLIDETIAEIEEIKKSDRFSATEIELKGPGEGIAGKPSNGKLDKDEDDGDDDDDDKDEEKKDKKEVGKNDAETGEPEGTAAKAENRSADPNGGHHVAKDEDGDDDDDDDKDEGKKDKEKDKGSKEHESAEKKDITRMAEREGMTVKKSAEEFDSLMKSMLDARVAPLEEKLNSILGLVKDLADAPVAPRGVTARMVPLKKSDDEGEPLTKSLVVNKLLDLKKSGTLVDSLDVTKAELGSQAQLFEIARKYNLK